MQSALDRALTTLCDSDVEVLINLCSSVMDPKGKVTVEYKDWNAQFLHVCLELCKYLTNDEVLRYVIGLCEVNHVLSGQRDTITVVLVLGNGLRKKSAAPPSRLFSVLYFVSSSQSLISTFF